MDDDRFKSLLNVLPWDVFEIDLDGRLKFVSDSPELAPGRLNVPVDDAATIHPDDLTELQRARASRDDQPLDIEIRVRRRDGAYRRHLTRTAPVNADGRLVGWIGTSTRVDHEKPRESATQFLANACEVLSEALHLDSLLNSVIELAVPRLADWCRIELADEQFAARRVVDSEPNPVPTLLADAARETSIAHLDARRGEHTLIKRVEPVVAGLIREQPELERSLAGSDFRSVMAVAIRYRGRTIGSLTLATAESGRRFGEDDLDLAEQFAGRFAMAIEKTLLYERLNSALQAKDTFLALVSHELRTPLTILSGTANTLRRHWDRKSKEDCAQALKDIELGAQWLARIVENMLTLARPEDPGAVELEPQLLRRLIGRMIAIQRDQFPGYNVVLTATEDLLPVSANPGYIRQIMDNLLSNARKYSPPNSTIDVQIERDGKFAAVTVSDCGIGINQEQLDEIFDHFVRVKDSSSEASGIGLGLAVCKRFVELQGGTISASQRPGGGSSFRFTVPLALAPDDTDDK